MGGDNVSSRRHLNDTSKQQIERSPVARELISDARRLRAIFAGSAGNLIEWYDFYVYAYTALYFASSFFPAGDRTAQLLNVAGIYAAGFLIRPIGGWFFGRYADRHGRRAAMVFSVLLMGAGSLLIAVLPTYETIGAFAPLALLTARLLQGFSTGGQYGAAATYLSEVAAAKKRGRHASFQFVTLIGGQLAALFVVMALQLTLSEAQIGEWGWRIPFAIGAILSVSFLLFRNAMVETVSAENRHQEAGSIRGMLKHPSALFIVVSLSAAGAVCLYTFTTYMQKYLVNTAGMDVKAVSSVMMGAMFIFMLLQPILGSFSDVVGRRKCLMIFSGSMTVMSVPIMYALEGVQSPFIAFALVALALLLLSFYTSISGLFKAELFPPHVRALGVGMAHSVAAAIFGGSAEYVALWFKQIGHEGWFYWYVAVVCAFAFVVALRMKEPRGIDMLH